MCSTCSVRVRSEKASKFLLVIINTFTPDLSIEFAEKSRVRNKPVTGNLDCHTYNTCNQ